MPRRRCLANASRPLRLPDILGAAAMTEKTGAIRTRDAETPITWRCLTCHFEVVHVMLPRKCPRCGASRVKFLAAGAATAEADDEA